MKTSIMQEISKYVGEDVARLGNDGNRSKFIKFLDQLFEA